jgi:hypothetical protein
MVKDLSLELKKLENSKSLLVSNMRRANFTSSNEYKVSL